MTMPYPIEIAFHGIDPSDALEKEIRAHAAALEKFGGKITHCRVVVETPHRHQRKGRTFRVRVDLHVPGEEIVVRRDPPEHEDHADPALAARDAFHAAQRQLQDYVRRRRRDVKVHAEAPHARVLRIFPEEGYGFLESSDGREIYFHRNSVADAAFPALRIGQEVRFTEEEGEKGPQATSVRPG